MSGAEHKLSKEPSVRSAVPTLQTTTVLLGLAYVACSAGLIAFNKYLMHPGRFPYPECLVLFHSGFCSTCVGILFLACPSLFPSLWGGQRLKVDSRLILKGALPIATLNAAQLVLGNRAYLHSSVAFLQMVKEANLILVYGFSLMMALERFTWRGCTILVLICAATTLTIHGEAHFSRIGLMIQGSSQLFESLKIVLQAILLSGAGGGKLDALSFVLLVMPLCFIFLGSLILSDVFFGGGAWAVPEASLVAAWWPVLLVNACVAFALNVIIALFIKFSSAVAYILAGITKDAMIVMVGGMFLGEAITGVQAAGFSMQLCGILTWSLMKARPGLVEETLDQLSTVFRRHKGLDDAGAATEARLQDDKVPGYGAA